MILSIGYSGLKRDRLGAILEHFDACIVDVRGVPSSRNPHYSGRALRAHFGERYLWRGEVLGNKGISKRENQTMLVKNTVTDEGLEQLDGTVPWPFPRPAAILMCVERAPGDCHRHLLIARPLLARGVDVIHVYDDELLTASALDRVLTGVDDEYDFEPLRLKP